MAHPRATFHILGSEDIRAAVPMTQCIDLMRSVMSDVSGGRADLPLRTVMPVQATDNLLGVMPGHVASIDALGLKAVCLNPDNPSRGLSSHSGIVVLFDKQTGQLCALLDGSEITAMRTPAATAAASLALANDRAGDLAVLGTGEQALSHLEALALVHRLRRVRLWGRRREAAEVLALKAAAYISVPIEVVDSVEKAVASADIVCAVTGARDPVLKGTWLSPGAHVNLVGASVQSASEVDVEAVTRARYFVDYRPSALAQAGELKRAIDSGAVTADHVLGEIGDVHLGRCAGRISNDDITIYKSLGIAAQDLALAHAVYEVAKRSDLGAVGLL